MPLVSVLHVSPSVEERLQDGGVSACGLGCLVWLVLGFSFLSPPSDCFSLPSTMTWAPCPHGVRTRGKKSSHLSKALGRVRIYSTEERRLHTTCLETAKKAMESFGLFE